MVNDHKKMATPILTDSCETPEPKVTSGKCVSSFLTHNNESHTYFMEKAIAEANIAFSMDEVPIGCVIVYENKIIATSSNMRTTNKNVLHHAEILAIDQACNHINDWRLENCTLYVTLEPCPMCAGAIVQARIPRVVYGAKSPKAGCAGSILDILNEPRFNHQVQVITGVCETKCANLMSSFFSKFRNKT